MVGDNPETDVIGGKAIGAVTFQKIFKKEDVGVGNCEPDFIFNNFKDFHNLALSFAEKK